MKKIKIIWMSPEIEDEYSSGAANHNRLFVEYFNKHPDVEEVAVVRWPVPVAGKFLPQIQNFNGIKLYTPQIHLKLDEALKSFKRESYKFSEKIKFAFLRLILKLKGMSTFDPSTIKKAGAVATFAVMLLTFQKPFPNPLLKQIAKCIEHSKPDIIQNQMEFMGISGSLIRDKVKGHLITLYEMEGGQREVEEGTLVGEIAKRNSEALQWVIENDKVDKYIPVSESVEKNLIKNGVPKNKIQTIYSPIRIDKFPVVDRETARRKLGLPKNKKIIVSVGRMTGGKRFEDLVEMLRRFPDDVILYIKQSRCISDDILDTSKGLISLIKKYKLNDRVIINDTPLPYEQMAYVYQAADVGVYPFLDEPFGMCVAEIMACARPVIVYDSGYLPNFINKNGFVVKPLDIEDLYQKTKYLLEDGIVVKEMGEKGRELAQKYDINILGEKLLDLYKEFM